MKRAKTVDNLLFCAQDAGGFNALLPVLRKCGKMHKYACKVFLAGASRMIARFADVPFVDAEAFDVSTLKGKIVRLNPSLIVAGTSGGLSLEKRVLPIAQELRIPTLSILDFWTNYKARFNFDGLSELDLRALPTHILVMDMFAKREMMREGFPETILRVTGNPYFDTFRGTPRLKRDTEKIVFFDQALAKVMVADWHEDYGYTEAQVFFDLLETLTSLDFKGTVYISFHPLNPKRDIYDVAIHAFRIPVKKLEPVEKPFETTLREVGLFFGMNSGMLLEASLRGLLAVSYQPCLRGQDPLISNRLKLSTAVYKKERLKPVLKKILTQKAFSAAKKRIADAYTHRNATGAVIRCIDAVCRERKKTV